MGNTPGTSGEETKNKKKKKQKKNKKRIHQSLDSSEEGSTSKKMHISTPENSESETLMSKKYATRNEVPRNNHTNEKKAAIFTTSNKTSVAEMSRTKQNAIVNSNSGIDGKEIRKSISQWLFGQVVQTHCLHWTTVFEISFSDSSNTNHSSLL